MDLEEERHSSPKGMLVPIVIVSHKPKHCLKNNLWLGKTKQYQIIGNMFAKKETVVNQPIPSVKHSDGSTIGWIRFINIKLQCKDD